jgi:hypothetical protein
LGTTQEVKLVKNRHTHLAVSLAAAALLAAALACGPATPTPRPLPATITPYSAPTDTPPAGEATPESGGATPSGGGAASLAISDVTLSTTTPATGEWVTVTVTVVNEGAVTASGYQLVVIPHYGVGPPNPAGFEELADLAPGATYSTTFTPGVTYDTAGTYTVRVLVNDDWLAIGDPDSTGSGGDVWDTTVTVAAAPAGPHVVVTGVTLSTTTPAVEEWVTVQVSLQNQGSATATGFQLVLIPHYGWGPPNPAGFEELADLAPGATYSTTFTPGLFYVDAGTFTLRVLVNDDWLAIGDPDSTGSGGSWLDTPVTVVE